ncbi:MAG: BatA domain-containing protein [Planctomycetota bacterium]|nr:BatA domain-containing protein [Planctomycetota bacterium]
MIGLAFFNPLLLWALPLAAVPIIIHILNRRRFQKVPWAAMEFLLRAMKRNRKRLRMEQWLVLLLRVLAVLLLVFLVSRPQLGSGGLLGGRTHHVVILDDSPSMTQRSGSTDLFEKAQDKARQLADDLAQRRAGDLFSIARTSAPMEWAMAPQRVSGSFGRVAGATLKEMQVSDLPSDLGKALQMAVTRSGKVEDAARTEYYLVGDRRAWDWATEDEKPRADLAKSLAGLDKEREHVTVLSVGGQHDNLAVVDVKLQDRLAIASVPVTLGVDVKNFGLDPAPPTTVAVEVDGQTSINQDVPPLAPGERVTVPFDYTFHSGGPHRVQATLEPGGTHAFDDHRTLALRVRDKSRVLLVDGDPDSGQGETFFLQATLDVPESGIEAQVVTESGFDEVNLGAFDMVWLCNVQAPTQQASERLEAFVLSGGGLAVTLGPLVDAARYNELLWRGGDGPLPLPIGEIDGDPDRPEPAFLASIDHPMCEGVAELFQLVLGNWVQVKRWLTLEEPEGREAAVVARIRDADGPPMIATRTFGGKGGEVALFAITADRFWSNLPSTDLFLVVTHQLHHFAARRDDPRRQNLGTDGVWRQQLDPGVYRPDVTLRATEGDDERTYTAAAPASESAQGDARPGVDSAAGAPQGEELALEVVADLRELSERGAYEVQLRRHDGVPATRMIARNGPVEEGRLVGFDEAAFKKLYPASSHDVVTFVRDEGSVGSAAMEGEAWPLLASLLLAGLLLESLLAWRFGRR